VTDRASLEAALAGSGTRMIEVRLDRSGNVPAHEALNAEVVRAVESARA
jgi:hypothetical protein